MLERGQLCRQPQLLAPDGAAVNLQYVYCDGVPVLLSFEKPGRGAVFLALRVQGQGSIEESNPDFQAYFFRLRLHRRAFRQIPTLIPDP